MILCVVVIVVMRMMMVAIFICGGVRSFHFLWSLTFRTLQCRLPTHITQIKSFFKFLVEVVAHYLAALIGGLLIQGWLLLLLLTHKLFNKLRVNFINGITFLWFLFLFLVVMVVVVVMMMMLMMHMFM